MKKLIISLLFLGIVFAAPNAKAAEIGTGISTEALSAAQTNDELKAQLISLIKQLIAILQEQLNQIIIQEARIKQIESIPPVISGQVAIDVIPPGIKFGMFEDKITQNIYVRGYELAHSIAGIYEDVAMKLLVVKKT